MYQGTRVWEYHVLKLFPCRSRAHVDYFMEKSFSNGSSSHIYENTRCSNCSQTAWACSLQRAIEGARTRLESTAVCAFSKAGSTVALCSKCTGALTFFFWNRCGAQGKCQPSRSPWQNFSKVCEFYINLLHIVILFWLLRNSQFFFLGGYDRRRRRFHCGVFAQTNPSHLCVARGIRDYGGVRT